MKIQVLAGTDAEQWLAVRDNEAGWRRLVATCPWATPYQSPEFAGVWYRHYGTVWEPLLVTATGEAGCLTGLLPLARRNREIVGVGAQQAEYQGWLSAPEACSEFLEGATNAIFQAWPDAHLRLRYIDVLDNVKQLIAFAGSRGNVVLDSHPRPLMALDTKAIDAVLRKPSNRSKLNRLKRSGELVLKHDHRETSTASSLDEIITLYDFRQGAANGTCPFVDDERKKAFHLDWLARAPRQFSVFRMLLNDRIVAAMVGVNGPHRVSNAIVAYSPHFARHSPGKLLLYLIAQSLSDGETRYLDLTPGGDLWKERFATDHDQVYELNVWRDAAPVHRMRRHDRVEKAIQKALVRIGLPPRKFRDFLESVRHIRPRSVLNAVRKGLPRRVELRVYQLHLDRLAVSLVVEIAESGPSPRIDALDDLAAFSRRIAGKRRQEFLSSALKRIERGERIYSVRSEGALLRHGWWVRERTESFFAEVGAAYQYPEPGAVFYDFFPQPDALDSGWYQRTLACMLVDLDRESAADGGPRVVYVSVLADDRMSRQIITKLGFAHLESLYCLRAFGWSRCSRVSAADTR